MAFPARRPRECVVKELGEPEFRATIAIERHIAVGPAGTAAIFTISLDAARHHVIRRFIQIIAIVIGCAASRRLRALIGIGAEICYAFPVHHAGNGDIAMQTDAIRAAPVVRTDRAIGTLIETSVETRMC